MGLVQDLVFIYNQSSGFRSGFHVYLGSDQVLLKTRYVHKTLDFATNPASELDISWHESHALGVDGAQVGVLEERDEVIFRRFLQSHDGGGLEAMIRLELLSDLADQTLEGQFAKQEIGGLLVTTDLAEGDRAGAVTVRLLHTTGGRCRLARRLHCELCAGGQMCLKTALAGSLLGASHLVSAPFTQVSTL